MTFPSVAGVKLSCKSLNSECFCAPRVAEFVYQVHFWGDSSVIIVFHAD